MIKKGIILCYTHILRDIFFTLFSYLYDENLLNKITKINFYHHQCETIITKYNKYYNNVFLKFFNLVGKTTLLDISLLPKEHIIFKKFKRCCKSQVF